MAHSKRAEAAVARRILSYLHSHREAGDTLEGIMRWWMLRQRLSESSEITQRALERLVQTGEVVERRSGAGETMYVARDRTAGATKGGSHGN